MTSGTVERKNLTMRMGMRRFTRLARGFAKKVQNLEHTVSLHFMHCNFALIRTTLRVTPAIAAGVSDHVWSLEDITALAGSSEPVSDARLLHDLVSSVTRGAVRREHLIALVVCPNLVGAFAGSKISVAVRLQLFSHQTVVAIHAAQ